MRNELISDRFGIPINNRVLVNVTDTFNSFISKGGIKLVNSVADDAWSDSYGYNITEFIIRHGTVCSLPEKIYPGDYDWDTDNELMIGDEVWWNSISFSSHIPIVIGDEKYLLVDYHELLMARRNGEIFPINGNVLLVPVPAEIRALDLIRVIKKTDIWEIFKKGKLVKQLNPDNEFEDIWEEGEIIHSMVYDSPFQVEGDINKTLDLDLYACPLRMVLCTNDSLTQDFESITHKDPLNPREPSD